MCWLQNLRRLGLMCLLLASCVTPYDASVHEGTRRLIIEGLISTQSDRQYVQVSYSGLYMKGVDGLGTSVNAATVYVRDDKGQQFDFESIGSGRYQNKNQMKGVVGHTYQLFVTVDGKEYVSEPELLKPVPPIDNLYWEYNAANKMIDVYIDLTDAPTPGDGYLWRWKHYEEIDICKPAEIRGTTVVPCKYCCTRCWNIVQCHSCLNLVGDQFVNGNKIRRQLIATVPFNSQSPYFLLIEQRSLTAAGFQFWNSVKAQSGSTGGPFDVAPAPILGNIRNVADATEKVLGFFGASDLVINPLWINRQDINDRPLPSPFAPNCPGDGNPPPPCFPCEESVFRTRTMPQGWNK